MYNGGGFGCDPRAGRRSAGLGSESVHQVGGCQLTVSSQGEWRWRGAQVAGRRSAGLGSEGAPRTQSHAVGVRAVCIHV